MDFIQRLNDNLKMDNIVFSKKCVFRIKFWLNTYIVDIQAAANILNN